MDLNGYSTFFKTHSKHLYVPILGVSISTFSDFSLLKTQPLGLDLLSALFSCLAATFGIYILATLIQIVDDFTAEYFSINISWLFAVSLISIGISKAILHLKYMKTQNTGFLFDETLAFRLCSLFLIAIIMLQQPEKIKKVRAKKMSLKDSLPDAKKEIASTVNGRSGPITK